MSHNLSSARKSLSGVAGGADERLERLLELRWLRRLLPVLGPLRLVLDKNLSGRTPTQITRSGLA